MTEIHKLGAGGAGAPKDNWSFAQRTAWPLGLGLLGLGGALTVAAVLWSLGTLGFLALVTVFAGIFCIALGMMRAGYARLRRQG